MAIKTSAFSGWRLSGKDADAFLDQINSSEPNPKAKEAISRGRGLAEEYIKNGYVVIGQTKNNVNHIVKG